MFISFEGIDGSGKSTQAHLLGQSLRAIGYTVVEVREPGGTRLGEQIRELLLDPSSSIDPVAELLLFTAARAQLTSDVIAPALAQGDVVIADRFLDSTIAYQGTGRGITNGPQIAQMQLFATKGIVPDKTFYIDIPLSVAEARRGISPDRIERAGDDFYTRVRAGYADIAANTERFTTLDGRDSVESLAKAVLAVSLEI